jgi:putative hemolysin
VYREHLDNIVGILHVTDLIHSLTSPDATALHPGTLAREALTLPETLGAVDVLAALGRRGVREAIVIDEYGGTAGMVTFESLVERIVGDLGRAGRIVALADGAAEIDGLTLVPDVNERFELGIDEDTYTTVGGYVLGRIGRRARLGDTCEVADRMLRVVALDGLRVARVWLSAPQATHRTPDKTV